jgi:hypothetical protein
MQAVVWHDVGDIRLEDVPEPKINRPTDAIVRLTSSAIWDSYGAYSLATAVGGCLHSSLQLQVSFTSARRMCSRSFLSSFLQSVILAFPLPTSLLSKPKGLRTVSAESRSSSRYFSLSNCNSPSFTLLLSESVIALTLSRGFLCFESV